MGVVLLIIGLVGLVLTVASLIGLDFGGLDLDLGDSGAGLLSALMPGLTGFGLIGGGLLTFTDDVSTGVALLAGVVTGLVMAGTALLLVRWLWRSGEELPDIVRAGAEPLTGANITLVGDDVSGLTRSAGSGLASSLELIRGTTGIDVAALLSRLGGEQEPGEGAQNRE